MVVTAGDVTGIHWVEARDAAKHVHCTKQPHNQGLSSPSVSDAEAEELCSVCISALQAVDGFFFANQCFCKNIIEINYQKKMVTHSDVTTSCQMAIKISFSFFPPF